MEMNRWCWVALGVGVVAAAPARAYVFIGNPVAKGVVDRPAHDLVGGSATLDKVRMHRCGGGYVDYPVGASIDPTEMWSVAIDAGDWCGLSVVWDGAVSIDGPSFTVSYEEPYTSVGIDGPDPSSTPLTPFTVVDGTFSGTSPRLYAWIE